MESESPDPLDWRPIADRLIGVIDLKDGIAVHAVAGQRDTYQPVRLNSQVLASVSGDPTELVRWYRRYKIRHFYVADLDALQGGNIQFEAIESLFDAGTRQDSWMVDVGLNDRISKTHLRRMGDLGGPISVTSVRWIIASESAVHVDTIRHIVDSINSNALILGIDYREGQFIGPALTAETASAPTSAGDAAMDAWITVAHRSGVRRGLVLDVSAVGTGGGPIAARRCEELSKRYPSWHWVSGGGCRNVRDVETFFSAGCEACLVASALLPKFIGKSSE